MGGVDRVGSALVKLTMEGLSADEAEQYDRQIRLWGLEAQKRLRTSSVLVVGAKGLGAELCKNIVLAGVKSLTLLDHALVSPSDLGNRFLVSKDGESRAKQAVVQLQALNPNVDVLADTEPVGEKDDTFFTQFSAVCVSCSSLPFLLHINNVCRTHGIKFFCGDVWGFYGYFLSDLGEHEYSMEEVSEYRVGDETQAVAPVQDGEKKSVKKVCILITYNKGVYPSPHTTPNAGSELFFPCPARSPGGQLVFKTSTLLQENTSNLVHHSHPARISGLQRW
ncbi:SUMO-activating enzyme subunit 1 [Geodia barretti]|uniref:SUMO-activating enzyme subunit 1 n=1 Tax=Geodia barretti TaxID=519541 RepID=A0AA35R7C9_GEOBA|nr:SUMO-activating enzyme subunit 1 [Geodia barretti]